MATLRLLYLRPTKLTRYGRPIPSLWAADILGIIVRLWRASDTGGCFVSKRGYWCGIRLNESFLAHL
jgi:hypothetical protein